MNKPILILSALLLAAPAAGEGEAPLVMPAMADVQPGQWQLKTRDSATATRAICLKDVQELVQLQHGKLTCKRFVISNGPRETTVQYSCPGHGYGRTAIRIETPRLLQIDTQGIAGGEPFAAQIEARRLGDCPTATGMLRR